MTILNCQFFSWLGSFIYINWANHSLFIILGRLSALNLIFSDVILVPNCHGSKGEAINVIPHYLIDVIHNTVTPLHLDKLKIIQNINKLMFQVIFIFSGWILIKKIIVSSIHFVLRETDFFLGMWTPKIENIFRYMMEYISQRKFNKHSGER